MNIIRKRLAWPLTNTQIEVSRQLVKNGFKDDGKILTYSFKEITLYIEKQRLKKYKNITVEIIASSTFTDFKIIYDKWTTPDLLENFDEIKDSIYSDFSKFKKER